MPEAITDELVPYKREEHSRQADALLQRVAADLRAFYTPIFASPKAGVSFFTNDLITHLHAAYLAGLEEDGNDANPEGLARGVVAEGVLQSAMSLMVRSLGRGHYAPVTAEDVPPFPNMTWSVGPRGNIRITAERKVMEWDAAVGAYSPARKHGCMVALDVTTSANQLFHEKPKTHHQKYVYLMTTVRKARVEPRLKIRVLNILAGDRARGLERFPSAGTTDMYSIQIPGRDTVHAIADILAPDFALDADTLRGRLAEKDR